MKHGVVWLDHVLDTANVNPAAARLLDLPPGEVLASDFIAAMKRLRGRALNGAEIPPMGTSLFDNLSEDIDFTCCFAESPTLVNVSSYASRQGGFSGSVWAFEDISALPDALTASEAAQALLRASADAMINPQVLFEAVRDPVGRVVDFVYRSANRAAVAYLGLAEDELIGSSALATLPNLDGSGLLGRYAQCLADGQPVILDEFSYFNEILDDARRYDIRAARAGAELLSLTWSDVTERYRDRAQLEEARDQLQQQTDRMRAELVSASAYMSSIMPTSRAGHRVVALSAVPGTGR